MNRSRKFVMAAALLFASAGLARAAKNPVSFEALVADPAPGALLISEVKWAPRGRGVSFLQPPDSARPKIVDLWLSDAATGRRTKLIGADAIPFPTEKELKEETPLKGYQWSPAGDSILLTRGKDLWLFHLADQRFQRITESDAEKEFPEFSPDGTRIAFVQTNDLYCVELANRKITRLTADGTPLVFNGRLDWVYEEELASRSGQAYVWSPDSRSIAYIRLDDKPVLEYPIVNFLSDHVSFETQRYPQAGEPNPVPSVRVVGVDAKLLAAVEFVPADDVYLVPKLTWTPDARQVSYQILNRDQTHLDMKLLNVATGQSRMILSEADPKWLNVSNFAAGADLVTLPRFLKNGTEFLWLSERSGFLHLYLGNSANGSLVPITSGPWMVDRIFGVNEARRLVYFESTRTDARERELDRVRWDNRRIELLSSRPGTHHAELSPDGKYFTDRASGILQPPAISISESGGRSLRVLDDQAGAVSGYELAQPEFIDVAASDGTTLHGLLVKPADFDAHRKYPVIISVYGGPNVQVVRNAWGTMSLLDCLLAARGYLVWKLDNRGSWGRGHAFESVVYHCLGRNELEDQLAGVSLMKSLPFVDGSRIGIYGWSYGGYMTLFAATHAPDVWKCAIAGAPVSDWRYYDSAYTERYMGRPKDNVDGYRDSSAVAAADRIRTRLLEIHGTSDDNVHMQNTLSMIDAMTKAGVSYELQIQPGQKHGFRGKVSRDYLYRREVEFFEKNL